MSQSSNFMQVLPAWEVRWTNDGRDYGRTLIVDREDMEAVVRSIVRTDYRARIEIKPHDHLVAATQSPSA